MYNMLILEDNKEELDTYRMVLSEFDDIHTTYIEDQTHGMQLVSRQHFDCMIIDLKLKDGSGMNVIHEARLHATNRGTPIYLLSGFIDPLIRKIAVSFHVMDTVDKPIDFRKFILTVINQLKTKKVIYKYDAKLINVIINAGLKTFEDYFQQRPHVGRTKLKTNNSPARGQVTAVIDFNSSDGEGSMALSANSQFIKNIAKILLNKPLSEELFANEAKDILGEMVNQVLGRIKIAISQRGGNITVGLPKVMVKKNLQGYHETNNPIVFTPFGLDNYGCDMEFAMRKGELVLEDNLISIEKSTETSGSVILFD